MRNYLLAFLGSYEADSQQDEQHKELLNIVHDARDEWNAAQNYFENVSDPELVDYAIYKIEAARRKYMYLLKQARIAGIEDNQTVQQINKVNPS